MKNTPLASSFISFAPLEKKSKENRAWTKKRWQKGSLKVTYGWIHENYPRKYGNLVSLWGGRALLRKSCLVCCIIGKYLSNYNAVCIKTFNSHFHQPWEEAGRINSNVYFRNPKPKKSSLFPLCTLRLNFPAFVQVI